MTRIQGPQEEGTPLQQAGLKRALYRLRSVRAAAALLEQPDQSIQAQFRNQDSLTHSSSSCKCGAKPAQKEQQPCPATGSSHLPSSSSSSAQARRTGRTLGDGAAREKVALDPSCGSREEELPR
ncbi:unnamed protein product [Pleuronectes platessa]|uniref:Uncharacterized protein n=1 Tax=Pleuronectes platessa TaxID=8262 RepID=A0A9N7VUG8_PLEPL|nr:unnamed protein product [Pleuronectes platessa]